ncbi:hypothetical protein HD806DRAFT_77961 [Xylariaceae sp. AK1471]|nr:hypothetical protein HD806DRAFT_77961 [Xylariaceae sp. AK1471]
MQSLHDTYLACDKGEMLSRSRRHDPAMLEMPSTLIQCHSAHSILKSDTSPSMSLFDAHARLMCHSRTCEIIITTTGRRLLSCLHAFVIGVWLLERLARVRSSFLDTMHWVSDTLRHLAYSKNRIAVYGVIVMRRSVTYRIGRWGVGFIAPTHS